MRQLKTPDGSMVFHPGSEEEALETERILAARHAFNLKYMREQGWGEDLDSLTIEQILQIRNQPGWIAAGITVNVDNVEVDEKTRSFRGITATIPVSPEVAQRLRDAGVIE